MMKEAGVFLRTGRDAVHGIVTLTGIKVAYGNNEARTQHIHSLQSPQNSLGAKYAMQSFEKCLIIQDYNITTA